MANAKLRDLSAQRFSFVSIWGLPLVLLFSLNFTTDILTPVTQVGVAGVLLAWMGAACTLNAVRCRRLHCIIAGPVLLLGSGLLVLLALRAIDLGLDGPTYVIWGALGIVALSFLPERVFGRYLAANH
jgi:multidrug transporter EmrE-like cation transporter